MESGGTAELFGEDPCPPPHTADAQRAADAARLYTALEMDGCGSTRASVVAFVLRCAHDVWNAAVFIDLLKDLPEVSSRHACF